MWFVLSSPRPRCLATVPLTDGLTGSLCVSAHAWPWTLSVTYGAAGEQSHSQISGKLVSGGAEEDLLSGSDSQPSVSTRAGARWRQRGEDGYGRLRPRDKLGYILTRNTHQSVLSSGQTLLPFFARFQVPYEASSRAARSNHEIKDHSLHSSVYSNKHPPRETEGHTLYLSHTESKK